jgi:hypothetical protein
MREVKNTITTLEIHTVQYTQYIYSMLIFNLYVHIYSQLQLHVALSVIVSPVTTMELMQDGRNTTLRTETY